ASVTFSFKDDQSFLAMISFVNNCEPIPTHITPALNHPFRFCSVGSTPPVGMSCKPGTTGIMADTKPGPSTEPGKILMTSAPWSLPATISVSVAQPGAHIMLCALHTAAISGFIIGETIKCAPA